MKIVVAATALLLLTACRATFWAQAPLPDGGCDPATQGEWITDAEIDEDGLSQQSGLGIDAGCQLVAYQLTEGAVVNRSEPARIRMARVQENRYAWLDANTLLAFEGLAHRTRAGDVMVFMYQVENDQLSIQNVNHVYVRNLIASGRLDGEFHDNGEDEFNRITGPVAPAVLAEPQFFGGTVTSFKRAGTNE